MRINVHKELLIKAIEWQLCRLIEKQKTAIKNDNWFQDNITFCQNMLALLEVGDNKVLLDGEEDLAIILVLFLKNEAATKNNT